MSAAPPEAPRDASRALAVPVAAAALSCAHAVWMAAHPEGVPSPDAAHVHALALHAARAWSDLDVAWLAHNVGVVVPNPQLVAVWMGLCMAVAGATSVVAAASLAPFHLLAAWGLWQGGRAVGGTAGGAWALVAGLGAAGALAFGGQLLLDFPLLATVAYAAGEALAGRWGRASLGLGGATLVKLGAIPVLALFALDALVTGRRRVLPGVLLAAALYLPNAPSLLAYASASTTAASNPVVDAPLATRFAYHVGSAAALAGPAALTSVVLGLLGRGDIATLRTLGWALGALLGLLPLAFYTQPRYALPLVPLLVLAGAGAASARWGRLALAGLGALALAQVAGFHTARATWPGRPAALRAPAGEAPDVDGVLDWLAARAPAGRPARVALHLAGSDRVHYGLFAVRTLERALPLELVVVDDHRPLTSPTDLGVVVYVPGRPTSREAWRAALPAPTETWDWPDGYRVALWDTGLPTE